MEPPKVLVGKYMRKLRNIGLFSHDIMRKGIGRQHFPKKQFIIACLVSNEEVENGDLSVLKKFEEYLICNRRKIIYEGRSIRKGRMAVILNLNNESDETYTHGEARLLDPNGDIRKEMGMNELEISRGENELIEMKCAFAEEFSAKPYCLMIYSHYVPCTMKGHRCAEVIARYNEVAKHTEETVYVGYEDVFVKTEKYKAFETMESRGVRIIHPILMDCENQPYIAHPNMFNVVSALEPRTIVRENTTCPIRHILPLCVNRKLDCIRPCPFKKRKTKRDTALHTCMLSNINKKKKKKKKKNGHIGVLQQRKNDILPRVNSINPSLEKRSVPHQRKIEIPPMLGKGTFSHQRKGKILPLLGKSVISHQWKSGNPMDRKHKNIESRRALRLLQHRL